MNPWILIGCAVAGIIIYLNCVATIALIRSHEVSSAQKLAQFAFVWIVPVAGALIVKHLLAEQDTPRRTWDPDRREEDGVGYHRPRRREEESNVQVEPTADTAGTESD